MKSVAHGALLMALGVACGRSEPHPANSAASGPASALESSLPLRALGTEPFWALDIDTAGLRLITPDDTAGVRFTYSAPRSAHDTTLWRSTNPSVIEVKIWPSKCSDGMSDREYPYAARVVTGATIHNGCADRRAVIAPK